MKNKFLVAAMAAVLGLGLSSCSRVNHPSEKAVLNALTEARSSLNTLYKVDDKVDANTMLKNALDITEKGVRSDYVGKGNTKDSTVMEFVASVQPNATKNATKYYVYRDETVEGKHTRSLITREVVEDGTYSRTKVTKDYETGELISTKDLTEEDFLSEVAVPFDYVSQLLDNADKHMASKKEYTTKGLTNTIDLTFENQMSDESSPTEPISSVDGPDAGSTTETSPVEVPVSSVVEDPVDSGEISSPIEVKPAAKAPLSTTEFVPTIKEEFVFKRLSKSAYGTNYRLKEYTRTEYHEAYELSYDVSINYPTANIATGFLSEPYAIPFQEFLV